MNLTGPEKAAALMVSLGKEVSSEILKNFSEAEIKTIGKHLTSMSVVPGEIVDSILEEFLETYQNNKDISVSGEDFLKDILIKSQPGDKAQNLMKKIEEEKEKIPFKKIQDIDSKVLATFIRNEHPQTIAIILAHLQSKKAAEVISQLREDMQKDIVKRIANLERVQDDILMEVDKSLEEEILSRGTVTKQKVGGTQAAAEIVNCLDKKTEEHVLAQMEEEDTELAENIKKLMFVFEDLLKLDDRNIRDILKEIKNEDLTLALKGASNDLKSKIFSNLSSRAADMIKEDMEIMGPVRISDVEEAQQKIIMIVRKLEKEGKIIILSGGDSDQVLI